MDDAYEQLGVPMCDVKEIQNSTKGVSGFWLRAMLAHSNLQREIEEKDRAILAYLQDIRLTLHDVGFGFNLTFVFEENAYFTERELTKKFMMTKPNVVERCIGTNIDWAPGTDPTKEKKKKKKTVNGKQKTVTKTVDVDSFFTFFRTIDAPIPGAKPPKEDDDDESEKEDEEIALGEQMDHDFDMGNDLKDDIVPLALEYFLGIIEKEESDSDNDEDDDSDEQPVKAKKSSKKTLDAGKKSKEPKVDECKQQ